MTEKEKIKEEIESYKESMKGLEPHSDFRRGQITAYNHILQFIDSLPEEPASKDLEGAAVEAFKKIVDSGNNSFLEIFKAGAEWQRKQIMKDAVLETKVMMDCDGDGIEIGL